MSVTSSESYKTETPQETAQGRYQSLASVRLEFLTRARDAAELTIPTLVPPEGHGSHTKYYTPFQGVGARGVNNLASKLLLTLFPPNNPFFRLYIDPYALKRRTENVKELKTELDKALGEVEKAVQHEVESRAVRVATYETLRQLIVAGNALLFVPPNDNLKVHRLDSYVVSRDPSGNLLEIIIEETVAPRTLSPEIKAAYDGDENAKKQLSDTKDLPIYTRICRKEDNKGWEVYQELCGKAIESTKGSYPIDKLPYLALRFNRVSGEDYGRGYVEEYLGDLRSLEALSQAIVEGSAAAARILFLVRPNSTTRTKDIADAPNGAVRTGDAADVTVVRVDKQLDLQVAANTSKEIQERLAYAFLLNSAIQRNAERVTAEEIRYMAQELESSIGGTYTVMSQELQLPLVSLLMDTMQAEKRLPKLPKKIVKPVIVTGIEALGRGNDLNKLDLFVAGSAQSVGPEAMAQYLVVPDYLSRRATALGIDSDGLIRDDEEVAQQAQMAQLQQLVEKLGPAGIKSLTDMVTNGNIQLPGTTPNPQQQ